MGAERQGSSLSGGGANRVEAGFAVGDERHHGIAEHGHADTGFREFPHCVDAQFGARGERFH